ncbi:gliding motility-associated protein GldE [Proteiniphilum sp. UBA1028]|uniref:gliding motility-associated protein GldE n=1 Tax=Proteiniphilum sp. UBA1028 TaxID=1947251 RepID=UPI0025FCBD8B|nr:gliding motility-associated protein GldE [Proteiniphilum sp. UBA1028]
MDPDPLSYLSVNLPAFIPAVSDYLFTALLLLLILINAIISGSEIAFFTVDKDFTEEVNTSEKTGKIRISQLLRKPEKLLASIVIAYNFLNVTIVVLILYLLNRLPWFAGNLVDTLLLEIIIPIGIVLLFVDILPKRYASYDPLRFATHNAPLIKIVHGIMSPFSSLLVRSTTVFNRSITPHKHEISVDDLSKALEITSNEITREQEKEMLEGIIRFKDKTVDDIFVSRSDMVAIDSQTPFAEVIDFIVDAGFSRIPVYEENPDNIKGILYVKDLLPHLGKAGNFKWQTLIRPAYFVPGTKRIDDLLEEFRTDKNHMAIVVDEYGGTSGLVTMEDILEEIVGDISDEYDEELPFYTMAADGSYLFEGKTPLEEFIKITGLPEKDFEQMQDEVDTLAGLLLELKGDFPKRKESFTYKKHTFQAEEMSKKRITKVRYIPPKSKKDA